MTTQYTTLLKLALPVQGELSGTWGTVVNENITEMIEEAVAGLSTINSWTTNSHVLTTADGTTAESRAAILELADDGLGNPTAAATVICPALSKIYIVKNGCGQTATIKTSAGTGVAIPDGDTALVYCDGTNVVTGSNFFGNIDVDGGTIDGVTLGTNSAITEAQIDNININGNAITSTDANGNIALTPNGTGEVDISKVDIDSGTIDGTIIGANSAAAGTFTTLTTSSTISGTDMAITTIDATNYRANDGTAAMTIADTTGVVTVSTELNVDNINISGNSIISTDTNGNIALTPNGTGEVDISKVDIDSGAIDGTTIGANSAAAGTFSTLNVNSAYSLPTSDGTNGQVLTTDGAGSVTFADAGGGSSLELYAENPSTPTAPSATGTNSVAIGNGAVVSSIDSIALQNSRASGLESFAAIVGNNTTSYGAIGTHSIAIGQLSRAFSSGTIAIGGFGSGARASSTYAIAIGEATNNSGTAATALGYNAVISSGANSSIALGSDNINNDISGKITFGANDTPGSGVPSGNPKTGIQSIVAHTTDATATVMTTPDSSGQAAVGSETIPGLANNTVIGFTGVVAARQDAASGTASAAWKVEGLIRREGSAATTTLVSSTVTAIDNTPSWGLALSADTTNGGLKVEATGASSTNIRWVATIHTSEVTYA